jgi:hypothetical protein
MKSDFPPTMTDDCNEVRFFVTPGASPSQSEKKDDPKSSDFLETGKKSQSTANYMVEALQNGENGPVRKIRLVRFWGEKKERERERGRKEKEKRKAAHGAAMIARNCRWRRTPPGRNRNKNLRQRRHPYSPLIIVFPPLTPTARILQKCRPKGRPSFLLTLPLPA